MHINGRFNSFFVLILNLCFTFSATLRRPGRPVDAACRFSREILFKQYLSRLIVDGKIASSSSSIYAELAEERKSTYMSEYHAFKRYANRNNLINAEPNESECSDTDYTPFGDLAPASESYSITNLDENIFVDEQKVLKPRTEYSDVLIELIYNETKKPCCWHLGRSLTEGGNIKIYGVCTNSNCNAVLMVFITNDYSQMHIYINEYDPSVPHSKKRYLTSQPTKEKLKLLLMTESAFVVHAKLSNEYIKDNDYVYPAQLPTLGALRQRKHREQAARNRHESSTVSLAMMKEEAAYRNYIHDVGISPAKVYFGTPTQKEWLRLETAQGQYIILSIDATGIDILAPKYCENTEKGKPRRIYLYVITLHGKNSVPVFQVIHQHHDHHTIESFLLFFQGRYFNGKVGNEWIVDESAALILALIKVFTEHKTTIDYINHSFDSLFDGRKPPSTFIRIDRSHFVASIIRNKSMNKQNSTCKKFYRRIIGYLITIEDKIEAERIIEQIFIVMHSKYLYDDQIKKIKDRMMKLSREHEIDLDEADKPNESNESNDVSSNDVEATETKVKSKFKLWIEEIQTRAIKNYVKSELNDSVNEQSLEDNILYAPDLSNAIINILAKLPLFSNVMNSVYKSENKTATSSVTENGFKILKTNVFKKGVNIRLDHFVEKYVNVMDGRFKSLLSIKKTENSVAKQNVQEENLTEVQFKCDVETDEPFLLHENFGGLNDEAKVSTKPAKTIKRAQNSILNKGIECYPIPIMQNGFSSPFTKTGKAITTTNTCPFDSLFQIYLSIRADYPWFGDYFPVENKFVQLIEQVMSKTATRSIINRSRNELLVELLPEKIVEFERLITLDCFGYVDKMFEKLCELCPQLKSVTEYLDCDKCEYIENSKAEYYIRQDLMNFNVSNVQESLYPDCSNTLKKCKCGGNLLAYQHAEKIIAMNVEGSVNAKAIKLVDISQEIKINNREYALIAVIERREDIAHFVTHIRRSDEHSRSLVEWQTIDDLHLTLQKTHVNKLIYCSHLFYVEKGN